MHKYDVLEVVNEGSYGIVMKCKEKTSGSIVAIKKFKECDYEDELVRKTGFREKSILEMVSQKNIIHLRDSFKRKGRLYLVFDYVSKNLLEIIETNPKGLPPELVKYHMFQLLHSVEYLHSNQIIHRDLKPENILVETTTNLLKLCDFGFARFVAEGEVYTEYVSTRWYRSPELILSGSYGRPADIFALGCIMAECLDGQPLFPGDTDLDQLCLIQRVCGTLENQFIRKFYRNPRFRRYKFPIARKVMSLEERFDHILDDNGLQFLRSLLNASPKERMTANDALKHPYFRDICLNKYYIRGNRRVKSSSGKSSGPSSSTSHSSSPPTNSSSNKGGNTSPGQHRHHHLPKIRRRKRNRQTPPRAPLFPNIAHHHHPNIHPSLIHDHKIQKMLTKYKTKVKKKSGGGRSGRSGSEGRGGGSGNNNSNNTSDFMNNAKNIGGSGRGSSGGGNHKTTKSSQKGRKKKRRKRKKSKYSSSQQYSQNQTVNNSNNNFLNNPNNLPQIRRLSVGSRLGNKKKKIMVGNYNPHRRSSNPLNSSTPNKLSPHGHHRNRQFSPFKFSIPSIRNSFTGGFGATNNNNNNNNNNTTTSHSKPGVSPSELGRVKTTSGGSIGNGSRFYTPLSYSGRLKY